MSSEPTFCKKYGIRYLLFQWSWYCAIDRVCVLVVQVQHTQSSVCVCFSGPRITHQIECMCVLVVQVQHTYSSVCVCVCQWYRYSTLNRVCVCSENKVIVLTFRDIQTADCWHNTRTTKNNNHWLINRRFNSAWCNLLSKVERSKVKVTRLRKLLAARVISFKWMTISTSTLLIIFSVGNIVPLNSTKDRKQSRQRRVKLNNAIVTDAPAGRAACCGHWQ